MREEKKEIIEKYERSHWPMSCHGSTSDQSKLAT
jgi:hypothetical protein